VSDNLTWTYIDAPDCRGRTPRLTADQIEAIAEGVVLTARCHNPWCADGDHYLGRSGDWWRREAQ
jgi:hypothetical protein